jgi:hypothetical protein
VGSRKPFFFEYGTATTTATTTKATCLGRKQNYITLAAFS